MTNWLLQKASHFEYDRLVLLLPAAMNKIDRLNIQQITIVDSAIDNTNSLLSLETYDSAFKYLRSAFHSMGWKDWKIHSQHWKDCETVKNVSHANNTDEHRGECKCVTFEVHHSSQTMKTHHLPDGNHVFRWSVNNFPPVLHQLKSFVSKFELHSFAPLQALNAFYILTHRETGIFAHFYSKNSKSCARRCRSVFTTWEREEQRMREGKNSFLPVFFILLLSCSLKRTFSRPIPHRRAKKKTILLSVKCNYYNCM